MRQLLVVAAVIFGIPLLTLGWLYATDGKLLVVHNPGAAPVTVTEVTSNESYVERTEPKPVSARAFTWIIFHPQIRGTMTLLCESAAGVGAVPLGTAAKPMPLFADITIESCDGKRQHRVVPPQRLL